MVTRTIKYAAGAMVALAISLAAGTASATVSAPINVVVPPLAFEDTQVAHHCVVAEADDDDRDRNTTSMSTAPRRPR